MGGNTSTHPAAAGHTAPLLLDRNAPGAVGCGAAVASCFSKRGCGAAASIVQASFRSTDSPPPPWEGSPAASSSVPPQSFKASRPRKTLDVAGVERQNSKSVPCDEHWEVPLPQNAEPKLLEEADADEVTEKVAQMIFEYIQEGDEALSREAQGQAAGQHGSEFHEDQFLLYPVRSNGCFSWLRREGVACRACPQLTRGDVYRLIDNVASPLFFCKQVVVLCAIYIDRLMEQTSAAVLNSNTWRTIIVVTLLTASKVWEDVHPWNADFELCLREEAGLCFQPRALYRLESLFLNVVRWRVFVDGKMYAAYFFSLMSDIKSKSSCRRVMSENFDTIIEDEPYMNHSDSDHDRTMLLDGSSLPSPSCESSMLSMSPRTPRTAEKMLPWSREDLVSGWRKSVLDNGECSCGSAALKAKQKSWKLEAKNPYIGALRHAPRAPAPSRHLPQSEELKYLNKLAKDCAFDFGPPTLRALSWKQEAFVSTISGATGAQLAHELRAYLESRKASGPVQLRQHSFVRGLSEGSCALSPTNTAPPSPGAAGLGFPRRHSGEKYRMPGIANGAGSLSALQFGFNGSITH